MQKLESKSSWDSLLEENTQEDSKPLLVFVTKDGLSEGVQAAAESYVTDGVAVVAIADETTDAELVTELSGEEATSNVVILFRKGIKADFKVLDENFTSDSLIALLQQE